MRKSIRNIALGALWTTAWIAACGAPKVEPKEYDGKSGATDLVPAKAPEATPEPAAAVPPPAAHVCEAPIDSSNEVWARIEAIRALPAEERAAKCGLPLVVILTAWRSVPADILAPIVERAAADAAALDAWVAAEAPGSPKAAADVVAMDVVGRYAVGGDSKAAEERRAHWLGAAAGSAPEIAAALEEAKLLPKLLTEVNAVHELRCLLEVNALGFAVKCKPIHPATTPITLNWTSATRDGVLEKLELTSCAGKSCAKLKTTAAKLLTSYRALVGEVEKLKTSVYREQILKLMVLPPFTSRAAE
jgi:hypothetical protein